MTVRLPHEQAKALRSAQLSAPPRCSAESLICGKDVVWFAALPALTALAWLLPVSLCERLGVLVSRLAYAALPERYAVFERMFRELLPDIQDDRVIAAMVQKAASLHHLERLLLLRLHRPLTWRPRVGIVGREHIERALAAGRGAILWVKPSSFSDVMTKFACHQDGFSVSHLSRHTHGGFSSSRLGIKLLNPIRISIECRYLARRVVIDPQNPRAALDQLAELLSRNQLVSITVGAEAKRITWVPTAGASVALAGGAAKLAIDTGAPLLPVFTERAADGSFLVIVEAPVQGSGTAAGATAAKSSVTEMLCRYGALLGTYLQRLPEQHHCLGLYAAASAESRRAEGHSGDHLAEQPNDSAANGAPRPL